MSTKNIIRAWKDPVYRNNLSAEERAALPAHPAGAIELSDDDLKTAAGGRIIPESLYPFCKTFVLCPSFACSFSCSYVVCPA